MKTAQAIITLCAGISLLFTGVAMAKKSSAEFGETLFNDQSLAGSTNDSSCNSCHEKGKGLEKAAENPDLNKAINRCVIDPLGGEKIDGRSAQMRSLKMYILSLHPES